MNKNLIRYPEHLQSENLFAWSSADELLVEHTLNIDNINNKKILIINDQFGAISSNLSHLNVESYTDSYIASKSIQINSLSKIEPFCDLSTISKKFDLILVYLPKNLSFFEDILSTLTQTQDTGTKLIFTGMVKHISKGHFKFIESIIGELTTSLAVKKARLIFSSIQKNPIESSFPKEVSLEGFDNKFTHHSNIFSRDKLDIGTRFFLQHLPKVTNGNVLDLGCANGILGIKLKQLSPEANIFFSDESYMAIKSSKVNYTKFHPQTDATFLWTHSTEGLENTKFDLVLCNPPFHQGNTVGVFIAIEMFKNAYKCLKDGGALRIVANSHLGYQKNLKRIFGNYKLIASNKKFVILESIK